MLPIEGGANSATFHIARPKDLTVGGGFAPLILLAFAANQIVSRPLL